MAELLIDDLEREEAAALLGSRDENLRVFREALGLKVVARGQMISFQGPEPQLERAGRLIEEMRSANRTGHDLGAREVRSMLQRLFPDLVGESAVGETVIDNYVEITGPVRRLHTKTSGQSSYVDAMRQFDLVFCIGPAGTGKTYLAVAQALESLHARRVKRIVLVRPAVEAGEKLGYLPGDLQAKVNPYLRPLLDALRDMVDYQQIKAYIENDVVELAPLAYMRGRTLNDAFIILDEAQNTTVPQMQMLLTRMGLGSKVVVTGDVTQVDLPHGVKSGLSDAAHRLRGLRGVGIVKMSKTDIVRHPLVQAIVEAYEIAGSSLGEQLKEKASSTADRSSGPPDDAANVE